MAKNENAAALGRLGKGHPKNYSPAEIKRRSDRLIALNKSRSNKNKTNNLTDKPLSDIFINNEQETDTNL